MPKDEIHAGVMSAAPAAPGEIIEARDVAIGTSVLTAPDEWVRRKAGSMFLITEFALPKAEGDSADGRLTVSSAMGSLEDNLNRWRRPIRRETREGKPGDASSRRHPDNLGGFHRDVCGWVRIHDAENWLSHVGRGDSRSG